MATKEFLMLRVLTPLWLAAIGIMRRLAALGVGMRIICVRMRMRITVGVR
ncbi:MAG: hypothetical protein ACRC4W_00220 [Treponemataceae bacterium]